MFLTLAALLMGIFTADVVIGAAGGGSILGNVGEMLVLFAASIAFVVAILQKEAAARPRRNSRGDPITGRIKWIKFARKSRPSKGGIF